MCSFISKSLRAPFSVCSKLISVSQFIVLSISESRSRKFSKIPFCQFIAARENIYEDMKDILEKEIQISDLYPPTNVVRTDFTAVFAILDKSGERIFLSTQDPDFNLDQI